MEKTSQVEPETTDEDAPVEPKDAEMEDDGGQKPGRDQEDHQDTGHRVGNPVKEELSASSSSRKLAGVESDGGPEVKRPTKK